LVLDGRRHLRACRVGQWVDGYHAPKGAPCSPACLDAGSAYLLGLVALGLFDVTPYLSALEA
jgi:hypothetical protein